MMETTIIITDVTRMRSPRVCVAGITEAGQCIRPIFEHEGIPEDWLYSKDQQPVIRPFAHISLDLIKPNPQPPHTEDWVINQKIKSISLNSIPSESRLFLDGILDPSVEDIFQAEIHDDFGFYIREGEGTRSLGTIRVETICQVKHSFKYNDWDYRIHFVDQNHCEYRLKVVDLAFGYYVNHLRVQRGMSCEEISSMLTVKFHNADIYLRIGLTRPTWEKHPHCCALQVTGVYTFPDYLEGRCFADYAPYRPMIDA
jgi:hypothetical protein